VSFKDRTINTTIYVKMDAGEPLLLSEGVYRQLGIDSYHSAVAVVAESKYATVRLVNGITLPPRTGQSVITEVSWAEGKIKGPLLLEMNPDLRAENLLGTDILIPEWASQKRIAEIALTNESGFTKTLEQGKDIGIVSPDTLIQVSAVGNNESKPSTFPSSETELLPTNGT
jgi:hypothetical protein